MKKGLRILVVIMAMLCLIVTSFSFSACEEKPKYAYDKYENIAYGTHERQTLNLYLPKEKSGTVGLILAIHGGGWMGGDKSYQDNDLDYYCKYYGYATASINYHFISDEFYCDDIMSDISLSLEKIKEMASAQRGLNIEKVMLMGGSAGGHLALLYSYKFAETAPIKPVAVADYSGPTDLTDESWYSWANGDDYLELFSRLCHDEISIENYLTAEKQSKLLEFSPINYVSESTVPTIILHAVEDDVVPYTNATRLKERLDQFGVKNDIVTFVNSGHSLGNDKKHQKEGKSLFIEYAQSFLG